MPSIIDTLEQDEWWYAQDGMPVRVADMEHAYVMNLLAFLRRGAVRLYRHALWRELQQIDREDIHSIRVREWGRQLPEDPAAWLERRPLVRVLEHRLRLFGSVDGDVVTVMGELT